MKPDNPHHGCYNRKEFKSDYLAQNGWTPVHSQNAKAVLTREPVLVKVNDPMTRDCQYSIRYGTDPKCHGCKHNQHEKEYGTT